MTERDEQTANGDVEHAATAAAAVAEQRPSARRRGRRGDHSAAVDDDTRTRLQQEIANDYETVFSWRIKELTSSRDNVAQDFTLTSIREKRKLVIMKKRHPFNMKRLCLQLIAIYELYDKGSYSKSFREIKRLVDYMDSCTFHESDKQYINAYNHIVRSTYAYIALSVNMESKKIIENVESINILNEVDKAVICTVKAQVFMEYPPQGNDIALKFADQAHKFNSAEPNWATIWLKAKGRFRRFYRGNNSKPDKCEILAAEMLRTVQPNAQFLIEASNVYYKVARVANNQNESHKYYKLTSDHLVKAFELIDDATVVKQLPSCLLGLMYLPKEYTSKTIMEEMVEKLKNAKYSNVDANVNDVLGEYYFTLKKEYEKAKVYFSRGMSLGHFRCAMRLMKIECLLQSENYPLVETLIMIYEVFTSPKRRLIIVAHIILHYFCENNPEKVMHYLKLYMDQNIDDNLKKYHLINASPIIKSHSVVEHKQFLNVLTDYVIKLTNYNWSTDEKTNIDDTIKRFNEMLKVNIHRNGVHVNNKTFAQKPCHESNSSKTYFNKEPQHDTDIELSLQTPAICSAESDLEKNIPQNCLNKLENQCGDEKNLNTLMSDNQVRMTFRRELNDGDNNELNCGRKSTILHYNLNTSTAEVKQNPFVNRPKFSGTLNTCSYSKDSNKLNWRNTTKEYPKDQNKPKNKVYIMKQRGKNLSWRKCQNKNS